MDLRYNADLKEVTDGDTFEFDISVGILDYDMVIKNVEVRLMGVDTHETYGTEEGSKPHEKGEKEKQFVEDWFDEGYENYDGDYPFTVVVNEQEAEGKYGRIIGDVIRQSDGKSLSKTLGSNFEGVKSE